MAVLNSVVEVIVSIICPASVMALAIFWSCAARKRGVLAGGTGTAVGPVLAAVGVVLDSVGILSLLVDVFVFSDGRTLAAILARRLCKNLANARTLNRPAYRHRH